MRCDCPHVSDFWASEFTSGESVKGDSSSRPKASVAGRGGFSKALAPIASAPTSRRHHGCPLLPRMRPARPGVSMKSSERSLCARYRYGHRPAPRSYRGARATASCFSGQCCGLGHDPCRTVVRSGREQQSSAKPFRGCSLRRARPDSAVWASCGGVSREAPLATS